MATTVGRPGERGYKVIPKRTSLRDRQRISQINKQRKEEGKEALKETSALEVPLESQKEIQQKADDLKAAQATVRQLNESAKRTGSANQYDLVQRDGQLQVVKRTVERRNAPIQMGAGGPQQIPALQSQISRQETSVKEEYTPVASAREGGQFVRQESTGTTFREVGTSEDGGTILAETNPQVQYLEQKPVFSERPAAGFVSPTGFLNTESRKKLVQFGEFLEKGGKDIFEVSEKAPPGVNVAALTTSFATRFVGGRLQNLGADPMLFTTKEVVLPSTTGALFGATSRTVVVGGGKAATAVGLGTSGAKVTSAVLQTGLAAAGTAALTTAVVSRSPEEQSLDVVFAGLGAKAGAKPTVGLDVAVKDAKFYGGAPGGGSNRASRLNLKTARKPQSKAQIRKQSFNQQYNPQYVEKPGYLKVKSPTTGETRIYVQQAGKQKNVVFTREVITKTTQTAPGVQRVQGLETKRSVGFQTPKTTYEQVSFPTTKGRVTQTRVAYGKEVFNYETIKGSTTKDISSGSSVTKQVSKQKPVNVANLPIPKTVRSVGKETPVFNQPQTTETIPSYELKPNAKVFTAPQSAVQSRVAGSQPGRGRVYENILARALAKNAQRTDFVLVNPVPAPVSAAPAPPVKDLALSGRFNNIPSVASARGVTSVTGVGSTATGVRPVGVVYDVQPTTTISRPIQQVKPFTAVIIDQKEEQRKTAVPALAIIAAEKSASTPKIFTETRTESFSIIKPEVTQQFKAAEQSVVDQRNRQRTEAITSTGFGFGGTTPPRLDFTFTNPIVPPKPGINPVPRPPPPKPDFTRFTEIPQLPPTPPRFSFPETPRKGAQYEVQVGSKGNKYFFDLGRGGTEVLTKARDLAKGTAAASIRVKPLTRGAGDNVSSFLGSDFTRNKAGVYVQKTETRISSAGEKAQIPGASKSKRLTKGSSYGAALNKVNKGASLRGLRRGFF